MKYPVYFLAIFMLSSFLLASCNRASSLATVGEILRPMSHLSEVTNTMHAYTLSFRARNENIVLKKAYMAPGIRSFSFFLRYQRHGNLFYPNEYVDLLFDDQENLVGFNYCSSNHAHIQQPGCWEIAEARSEKAGGGGLE
jgi:hypothetical protein